MSFLSGFMLGQTIVGKYMRNLTLAALAAFSLSGCKDPIIEKSKELLKSVSQATADARALSEQGDFKSAYSTIKVAREAVEKLLADEFNGDRCLFHDEDDGACPFKTDNPYTGLRGEGVAWNMYRSNLWLENVLDEVKQAENVGAYMAWEKAVYPSEETISRFLIESYDSPSWQDTIIFNLIIRPTISDQDKLIHGNICNEVKSLTDNEFKRREVLDKWRQNLIGYSPDDSNETLFRGISAVHVGDYSFDAGVFKNKRELVDRGHWSFETQGSNLVSKIRTSNELAKGSLGWTGVSRNCNVPYQAIADAVQAVTGETVSVPEAAYLEISLSGARNLLFMDIPVDGKQAERLISNYQRIGDRLATRDRQLAAMVFYELDTSKVTRSTDAKGLHIRVNASPRNITFYGFTNADWDTYQGYAGMFGEESAYSREKQPDTKPLFSMDISQ